MPPLAALLALALSVSAQPPGNRIVILTDSHGVGLSTQRGRVGFGPTLVELLEGPGRTVEIYAACSGRPTWFLPGTRQGSSCGTWVRDGRGSRTNDGELMPAITTVAADDVSLVVIVLGTNMANWRTGGVESLASAGVLARQAVMRGARCVWIGPPPIPGYPSLTEAAADRNYGELNSGLQTQVFGQCAYVRSTTDYVRHRGNDGIHYNPATGADWARQVYRDPAFESALAGLR